MRYEDAGADGITTNEDCGWTGEMTVSGEAMVPIFDGAAVAAGGAVSAQVSIEPGPSDGWKTIKTTMTNGGSMAKTVDLVFWAALRVGGTRTPEVSWTSTTVNIAGAGWTLTQRDVDQLSFFKTSDSGVISGTTQATVPGRYNAYGFGGLGLQVPSMGVDVTTTFGVAVVTPSTGSTGFTGWTGFDANSRGAFNMRNWDGGSELRRQQVTYENQGFAGRLAVEGVGAVGFSGGVAVVGALRAEV
jgi:hypothetical protein